MNSELTSFVLGSFFGFVTSIGTHLFRYYYFRPILKIENESKEDGKTFSCHSLKVRNVGRGTATNVQGAITVHDISAHDLLSLNEIKLLEDFGGNIVEDLKKTFDVKPPESVYMTSNKFRKIELEPLSWSELNSRSSITLFPGMPRLLDVCRFIKMDRAHQIQIPSSKAWQALLMVLKPKQYKITISVGSDEGHMTKKKFTIEYNIDNLKLVEGWG